MRTALDRVLVIFASIVALGLGLGLHQTLEVQAQTEPYAVQWRAHVNVREHRSVLVFKVDTNGPFEHWRVRALFGQASREWFDVTTDSRGNFVIKWSTPGEVRAFRVRGCMDPRDLCIRGRYP